MLYALVQYYDITKANHPVLKRPLIQMSVPDSAASYHLINASAIFSHAHVFPDFGTPDQKRFLWDKPVKRRNVLACFNG